eukprot:7153265-Alexandrium_andersonii.AAC.1
MISVIASWLASSAAKDTTREAAKEIAATWGTIATPMGQAGGMRESRLREASGKKEDETHARPE